MRGFKKRVNAMLAKANELKKPTDLPEGSAEECQYNREYYDALGDAHNSTLLEPADFNHKPIKSYKQKQAMFRASHIDALNGNPFAKPIFEFGVRYMRAYRRHISKYQEAIADEHGFRTISKNGSHQIILPGFAAEFRSKAEYIIWAEQGDLSDLPPGMWYNFHLGGGKWAHYHEGDIIINDSSSAINGEVYARNYTNNWKKWVKDKRLPYPPTSCSAPVILAQVDKLFDIISHPTFTEHFESIEPIKNNEMISLQFLFKNKNALFDFVSIIESELGKFPHAVSVGKGKHYVTYKDGKVNHGHYPDTGFVLVILINPADIRDEIFFKTSKGTLKSYYSQNLGKPGFTTTEITAVLEALAYSRKGRVLDKIPSCKGGFNVHNECCEPLEYRDILGALGAKRNVDATCKKHANATLKEVQLQMFGLGGNWNQTLKLSAAVVHEHWDVFKGFAKKDLPEEQKGQLVLTLVRLVKCIRDDLDKLLPKKYKLHDDSVLKIAQYLGNCILGDPDRIVRVACSEGSYHRTYKRFPTSNYAGIVRTLMGRIMEGSNEVQVWIPGRKSLKYAYALNESVLKNYERFCECPVKMEKVKIGWQTRRKLVTDSLPAESP